MSWTEYVIRTQKPFFRSKPGMSNSFSAIGHDYATYLAFIRARRFCKISINDANSIATARDKYF